MDVLTQKKTIEFIKKLQKFNSKKGVKHRQLRILEPRAFDFILQLMKCKKVLELNRVSNSCEQICNELGIEYHYVYSHVYDKRNRKLPANWDGDVIMGLTALKDSCTLVEEALTLLNENNRLMIFQHYNFLESWNRYLSIFKKRPFNKMYLTVGRFMVSNDGKFDANDTHCYPSCNGAWYVWEGGNPVTTPTIEWITDELQDKYFLQDEFDDRILKYGRWSKTFKKPIEVTVDRGTSPQDKASKEKRKAEIIERNNVDKIK